jgi:acyl-CoA hydrolase
MELTRRDSSTMPLSKACVRMVEQVSSVHDVGLLLQRMDIATCAAAERHTKVNCVTVAMGDVVVEHSPRVGELLTLTAEPVLVGRTSIDVQVRVSAEKGQVRRHVCDAAFTYVTTRGPDGEKRFCPPLEDDDATERTRWARATAKRRRALLKLQAPPPTPSNETFTFETIEVVLPKHQNHMGHTFGGVVMSWMHKAARTCCARHCGCAVDAVRTQGVDGVSFNTGSNVSDHLVFRARATASFDGGLDGEVKVRAVKRDIATGTEQLINVGYFSFGFFDDRQRFPSVKAPADALVRRRMFVARRRLLTCTGGALDWHASLVKEAPALTLESSLRLFLTDELRWEHCADDVVWASGSAWGRDSFVLKTDCILPGASVDAAFRVVKDKRPAWDHLCVGVEQVEAGDEWDIVRHESKAPAAARFLRCLCRCSLPASVARLTLLRAWRKDGEGYALATRSVRHADAGTADAEVLPACWRLMPCEAGVALSYAVEFEYATLRANAPGLSDARLRRAMARAAATWCRRLVAFEFRER